MHIIFFEYVRCLEGRGTHRDTESLCLIGACDDAAVIVGQHDYGPASEAGIKCPLTGDIKIITINKCENRSHIPNPIEIFRQSAGN
ncbi:hypothetical protein ES703_45635 [subsurface metagenome]